MPKNQLTDLERETLILWNREEAMVRISTYEKKQIKRLRRMADLHPEVYRVSEPDAYGGIVATFPKELLRITYAAPMSAEQKQALSDMARKMGLGRYERRG